MDKHSTLLSKLKQAKKSQFGVTAIKVELEAQFGREELEGCYECNGEGDMSCDHCDGDGMIDCDSCAARGEVDNPEDITETMQCADCNGNGNIDCAECEATGRVECYECHGEARGSNGDFESNTVCYDWIMERLEPLGLAVHNEGEEWETSHGDYSYWHPTGALKYAEFYNDGSVDSEFTFTISIEDEANALLIPKIMDVFVALGKRIDNVFEVTGAGMHTAFLSSRDCTYGEGQRPTLTQLHMFENFKKSATLLLPALYFLGTTNETSRGLGYRAPQIACSELRDDELRINSPKYSAIAYRNRALEFRVFDTCYDNTEAILDNLIVMTNFLKYWSSRYIDSGMGKVVKEVKFGNDGGNDLQRLYATSEHLDLLNAGLLKLKPSYYTISELKTQRKFKTNKHQTGNVVKRLRKDAKIAYREYEERFKWNLSAKKYYMMAQEIEHKANYENGQVLIAADQEAIKAEAEKKADEAVKAEALRKRPEDQYTDTFVKERTNNLQGRWVLKAGA